MRYATGVAFRTGLEHQLKRMAQETGLPLDRLRKAVVFERFLARLVLVGGKRWLLKGGLAMNCRRGDYWRPSKDIDIAHEGDLAQAEEDFRQATAAQLPENDFFSFDVRYEGLFDAGEAAYCRFRLDAYLGDRIFERASIDVAFEATVVGRGTQLSMPSLLGFSELPAVTLEVVPVERHLADKVDAYLRGQINERSISSREKDLADMVVIAGWEGITAGGLRAELDEALHFGPDQELPAALPEPPKSWGRQYTRFAKEMRLAEEQVEVAYQRAAHFLNPLLAGDVNDSARWIPGTQKWDES